MVMTRSKVSENMSVTGSSVSILDLSSAGEGHDTDLWWSEAREWLGLQELLCSGC